LIFVRWWRVQPPVASFRAANGQSFGLGDALAL
jgi:hypothetical protein